MNAIVPLFLLAPLVVVPFGWRLLGLVEAVERPPQALLAAGVPASVLLALSFLPERGPVAGALAVPWWMVVATITAHAGLRLLRAPDRFRPSARHATDAAVTFLAVGATFAIFDRLGFRPLGLPSIIVLLTAVHFHFAGFVLPLAGALAYTRRPSRWLELALGLVVVGIPVTALGFMGLPLANWIGALLTAGGGSGIGLATIAVARHLTPVARSLALIAGASLVVSMPMAVTYATGSQFGVSWIGLDVMAHIHGGLNAVGFALAIVVAWTVHARRRVASWRLGTPP